MISNSKLLIIANEVVELGEQKLIKIPVGQLPSGTKIYTHVFVNKSIAPGPTILLIGGMHGDEINGTEIVRRAAEVYKMNTLHAGTLITIPLLNVYGFIRFTRDVAEGKDVNRSFPGNAKGSLAARIANILYNEILPHATILIDFHTGGEQRYNYPQVRFSKNDQESLNLAKIFSSPFMVESNWRPHSLRHYAGKFKIPNLAFEGGESSRFDGYSIDKALTGIENVLVANQMISPLPQKAVQESIHIKSDIWIRASSSGIFVWSRSSGVFINKGEILATIADPDNIKVHYVFSRLSGYIIGHNNASVVHVGDALFHIGMT